MIREIIKRNINGKKGLIIFILTNIIYTILLLITIPKVMNFSNGMKLFDMLPTGYNVKYAHSLSSVLGEKGRGVLFN